MASTIGQAVRQARRKRRWNCGRLAQEAAGFPGAPDITERQVENLERARNTFTVDDPEEPLPWVLRALGLGVEVVAAGLGLGIDRAA